MTARDARDVIASTYVVGHTEPVGALHAEAIIQGLTAAGFRIVGPGEVDAETVEEPDAVKLLRGPLSRRATSAEFNEWQAREIVEHIDTLRSLTGGRT